MLTPLQKKQIKLYIYRTNATPDQMAAIGASDELALQTLADWIPKAIERTKDSLFRDQNMVASLQEKVKVSQAELLTITGE